MSFQKSRERLLSLYASLAINSLEISISGFRRLASVFLAAAGVDYYNKPTIRKICYEILSVEFSVSGFRASWRSGIGKCILLSVHIAGGS